MTAWGLTSRLQLHARSLMLAHLLGDLYHKRAAFQRVGATVLENVADHVTVGIGVTIFGLVAHIRTHGLRTTKAGAFEKPALKTFMEQVAPGGRAEPRYTPEVYKAISDAIQATMLGGAVPATAAAEASAKIDAFLSGYKGAPII